MTTGSDAIVRRAGSIAAQTAEFGVMRWLLDGDVVPGTAMTLGEVVIRAGRKNPLHAHPNAEEVLFLVEGALEHRVGEATYRLEPGDCIRVPAGEPHNAALSPNPKGCTAATRRSSDPGRSAPPRRRRCRR